MQIQKLSLIKSQLVTAQFTAAFICTATFRLHAPIPVERAVAISCLVAVVCCFVAHILIVARGIKQQGGLKTIRARAWERQLIRSKEDELKLPALPSQSVLPTRKELNQDPNVSVWLMDVTQIPIPTALAVAVILSYMGLLRAATEAFAVLLVLILNCSLVEFIVGIIQIARLRRLREKLDKGEGMDE